MLKVGYGPMSPGLVETNWLIAVGISVDAAALTVCDFQVNTRLRRAFAWVLAVTFTHSVLPVAGLAGVWLAAERMPAARTALYAASAVVAALLFWRVIADARTAAAHADLRGGESTAAFLVKVALVSADAVLIGPGAAAATRGWTGADLTASLALSALFVAAILTTAAAVAWWIGRYATSRAAELAGLARLG